MQQYPSTWTELGIYPQQGSNLYPPDNATYGLDTVGLGNTEATGGPTLDSQVVAAIAGYQNVLGIFGLGQQPLPVNPTHSAFDTKSFMGLYCRGALPYVYSYLLDGLKDRKSDRF
ncbi:MAG: hypothetical protein Q9185_006602 [Variospora sp. 1 TL-2023]